MSQKSELGQGGLTRLYGIFEAVCTDKRTDKWLWVVKRGHDGSNGRTVLSTTAFLSQEIGVRAEPAQKITFATVKSGVADLSEAGSLIEPDGFHLHSIFIKENKSND